MPLNLKIYRGPSRGGNYNQTAFRVRIWFSLLAPTITEDGSIDLEMIHPLFTCRDLLSARLSQSKLLEHYPKPTDGSGITKPATPLDGQHYMLIALRSYGESLNHTLGVLNNTERLMGFKTVSTVQYLDHQNHEDLMAEESYAVKSLMVIVFPEEWCRNTITFSLFTGMLRYLIINRGEELDLPRLALGMSTGGVIRESVFVPNKSIYDSYARVLYIFMTKWQEIFPTNDFLGIKLEDDKFKKASIYKFPNGEERYLSGFGDCGIQWFKDWVTIDKVSYEPTIFGDAIRYVRQFYHLTEGSEDAK